MGLLDGVFGAHEMSLRLRGERAAVLAANLANADTPNYKARDLDFASVLAGDAAQGALQLVSTRPGHLPAIGVSPAGGELKYRIPFQPSLDGNTVESHIEQAAFGENAVRYQASLMFINRRIAAYEAALTGQ